MGGRVLKITSNGRYLAGLSNWDWPLTKQEQFPYSRLHTNYSIKVSINQRGKFMRLSTVFMTSETVIFAVIIGRGLPLKSVKATFNLTRKFRRLNTVSMTNKTVIFAVIIGGRLALKSERILLTNEAHKAFLLQNWRS